VAACGLWAWLLALRKAQASSGRWRKLAPDVVAVATTAASLLVLTDRSLLTQSQQRACRSWSGWPTSSACPGLRWPRCAPCWTGSARLPTIRD